MVEITKQTEQYISKAVSDRAKESFVKRLDASRYLVTPKPYAKSRRLVTFTIRMGHLLASCENYYTGETCPANEFGQVCYHVIKALHHVERLTRKAA